MGPVPNGFVPRFGHSAWSALRATCAWAWKLPNVHLTERPILLILMDNRDIFRLENTIAGEKSGQPVDADDQSKRL